MWERLVERLTTISNSIRNFSNLFGKIGDLISSVFTFILDFIKFILFVFKTLINYVVKVFDAIFNDEFFGFLNSVFNDLSLYIGGFWTTILIGLFTIIFLLMLVNLISRLLKLNINTNKNLK